MRIRPSFAGLFILLLLLSGYLGLLPHSPSSPSVQVNDKALHAITFFLLTVIFYWILDTNRRRTLNFTLVVCTAGLGLGSELLQGLLPNGRDFDPLDVAANVAGSLAALALCAWYHKRMLERKRLRKMGPNGTTVEYDAVPGEDDDRDGAPRDDDLELGEGIGLRGRRRSSSSSGGGGGGNGGHEEGVVVAAASAPASALTAAAVAAAASSPATNSKTLEQELDNWDENEVDAWDDDDDEGGDIGASHGGKAALDAGAKKRAD